MNVLRRWSLFLFLLSVSACKNKPPTVSVYKIPKGNTEIQAAKFERMAAMLKEKRLHGQN